MKRKILWLLVSCVMALSLVIASCGPAVIEEEEEVVTEEEEEIGELEVAVEEAEEEVVAEAVVPWWKKDPNAVPEYGGTFTYATETDPYAFDPYFGAALGLAYDSAAMENWMAIGPEVWSFETRFCPPEYFAGGVVESWEVSPDVKTMTLHVRKGVYWQDIPPVNGRELTAYDIEFSWQRQLGLGSGYTEPSSYISTFLYGKVASITATDKYTVVIKWAEASLPGTVMFLDTHTDHRIVAPEAVKLYGNVNNWRHTVGTGPFILEDYVSGSALTYSRNPNYWGYDEHWPENRLPYVDTVKNFIIPDASTRYAAMRTGRLDMVTLVKWEDAAILVKSNPELAQLRFFNYCFTIVMPVDREPWSDIRVRKAMQMSIDLDTIAKTYYGGIVPGTPIGTIAHKGYRTPYEDWPQEVKDAHAYNPEGAKELLAEAGYPNGFKCRLTMATNQDMDLAQVLVDYFSRIGVDMKLDLKEFGAWRAYVRSGRAELCTPIWKDFTVVPPQYHFPHFTPGHYEYALRHVDDPVLNELVSKTGAAVDWEEMRKLIVESDMHVISQFYNIRVLPAMTFNLYQPWVKRFAKATSVPIHQWVARLWIDQGLKEALGR